MADGEDNAISNATEALVDELHWLHAHEYAPWGVHVAATLEHKATPSPHAHVVHFGISGARSALIDDSIAIVVGGRDHPTDHIGYTSRLDLFDLQKEKWLTTFDIKGDNAIVRRIGHSVVSMGSRRVIVFGGESLAHDGVGPHGAYVCLNDCHEVMFENNVLRCSPVSSDYPSSIVPSERAWHSANLISMSSPAGDDRVEAMVVIGGRDASGKFLGDLWTLSARSIEGTTHQKLEWNQLAPTGSSPLPLAYHCAVSIDSGSKLLVFGGRQSSRGPMLGTVFVLDILSKAWSQASVTSPCGDASSWLGRSNSIALQASIPVIEATGHLAQIMRAPKRATPQDEDQPEALDPVCSTQILVFGGFSERQPVCEPTRFAFFNVETGVLREVHAPNLGVSAYIGQAAVSSSDGKSVFLFGGVDAHTHQLVGTTSALHFWKPQPGSDDDDAEPIDPHKIYNKVLENGDEYTGEMDLQGVTRQGQGRCVYHDNGGMYEGAWADDKRHGQGVMTYKNGDTYAGQWMNDKRHGFGIYEVKQTVNNMNRTEVRYEGQWDDDQKSGNGIATYSDGSKLEATWVGGTIGQQSYRIENYDDGNGPCTYVGHVVDGVPHGQGKSEHTKETYEGAWLNGKRSGNGTSTLYDGTTYSGTWRNGKKNGFGTCDDARTRDHYEGKWVGGLRCGRGLCRYANGSQYNGEWKDDKCHGIGRYTFPDGTFYEGNWKENKFCGDGALVLDLDEPQTLE